MSVHVIRARQYQPIGELSYKDVDWSGLPAPFLVLGRNMQVLAGGYVGVFRAGPGMMVAIEPRFPMRNLDTMVSACGSRWVNILPYLRSYATLEDSQEWLVEAVRERFVSQCQRLGDIGLLKDYVRKDSITCFPLGRLDLRKTVRLAAHGMSWKAACWHVERTSNIPVNAYIKSALQSFESANPKIESERIAALNLFEAVEDIEPDICERDSYVTGAASFPENWSVYQELVSMARLLNHSHGVSLETIDSLEDFLPSLSLDFQHLFEDYVRLSLKKRISDDYRVLDGNTDGRVPLYQRGRLHDVREIAAPKNVMADCDMIVVNSAGQTLLACEIKCTPLRQGGLAERKEVEQAVVYALRFGLRYALTLHPVSKQEEAGFSTPGRIGGVEVLQYNVDVDSGDIEAEMDRMASSFKKLLDIVVKKRLYVNADSVAS